MMTSIISKMLKEYKIICGFTVNNPTVLKFEPPLTIEKKHIDYFVHSLDSVLSEQLTIVLHHQSTRHIPFYRTELDFHKIYELFPALPSTLQAQLVFLL